MAENEEPKPNPKFIVALPSVTVSSTAATTAMLIQWSAEQALGIPRAIEIRESERAPNDHPIYSFVGRVASEWAHLEHSLDLIIWELAGIDQIAGACITAQILGATPRYRTLLTQLALRAKTEPDYNRFVSQINSLMQDSYNPQERRIIHDPWYVTFDTGLGVLPSRFSERLAQFKSMPHKDPRFGIEDVDITDIEKTLMDIQKLSERVAKLHEQIKAALAASKQTQP
jgi:hypothetical protein